MIKFKILVLIPFLVLSIGCKKETKKDNTEYIPPDPIASFTFHGKNESPASIHFINKSQNADIYIWSFGDGTSSN